MPPSSRFALNSLAGRRRRTVLMAGTVALAASLIVAVSCAIASSVASLDQRLTRFLGAADARIVHPAGARFDEAILKVARGWEEVETSAPRLGVVLTLAHADGRIDPATGRELRLTPNAVGVDFAQEQRVRPMELTAGSLPAGRGEIVIDPLTAERLRTGVGDTLVVVRFGARVPLRVAGVYARQKLGVLQRPRIYMDRHMLAAASEHAHALTSIYLILRDDVDVEAFCARRQAQVPDPLVLEPAARARLGFDQRVEANRVILVIATMLTFMVAGFIILVGMSTAVIERQREMALLRCLGASRGQLCAAQLQVGLIFGLGGALAGIPVGLGLAQLLVLAFGAYLPAGLAIDGHGLRLAAIGSVGAGVLGAVYPALVASRITPLAALTRAAVPVRRGPIVACAVGGAALIGLQMALSARGEDESRLWTYAYAGLPCLVAGWFLLAVPLLLGISALVAGPLARLLALPADMIRGSVRATPLRHGFTAGALMLGMSIHVDTWASGVSVQRDWLEQIRFADGFATRFSGITPEQQEAIAALPFVKETCPIGYLPARLVNRRVFGLSGLTPNNVICVGFDPRRFFAMNTVDWIQGDPETALVGLQAGDGALVAEAFLIAKGVGLGEGITLGVGRVTKRFRIVGVVSAAGLDLATQLFGIRTQYTDYALSCVFVNRDTVARVFGSRDATMLQVNLAETIDDEQATRRIEEAAPGVVFRSGRWIMDTVTTIATALITVQSAVAFAALVLASFAVGSVVAADVQSRQFEYGMLRAVGAGRGLLLRLILGEASLLALAGAVTGTLLGFQFAAIDARNLRDLLGIPAGVAVPVVPIAAAWLVLLALVLLLALPPALRLARHPPASLVAGGR